MISGVLSAAKDGVTGVTKDALATSTEVRMACGNFCGRPGRWRDMATPLGGETDSSGMKVKVVHLRESFKGRTKGYGDAQK
jgi:hypothetical protein